MKLTVQVVNSRYAYQPTFGLEEMGTRLVRKGDRLARVKSPEDALGVRVVEEDGNVRWAGVKNPSLRTVAEETGHVISFGPKSPFWTRRKGSDALALLRSMLIWRDNMVGLMGLWIFAKVEDLEEARDLAGWLIWSAQYWDRELRFMGDEADEKTDEDMVSHVATFSARKGYQHFTKEVEMETLREKAARVLGSFGSPVYVANSFLEAFKDVTRGAEEMDEAVWFRQVSGLSKMKIEGNRRFKDVQRMKAGRWLYEHEMLPQRFVKARTADDDVVDSAPNARQLQMGSWMLQIKGSKRTRLGCAPVGPREVGQMVDTCVPCDA